MKNAAGLVSVALLLPALAAWALWTPDRDMPSLEKKYLASAQDLVSVLGVQLHVRDSGPKDAPVVLLLHGFASSLQTWDAWAAPLSREFRVVRLDLPGSGLSSPDPTADYSDRRSLQIIVALLDRLGIARTSVVGNSMGGRLAWMLAAAEPQRVNRLVLISPDGFASPGFEYGKAPQVSPALQLMRYTLPKWLLRKSLEPAYANPSAMSEDLADRYYELVLAPGARLAMIQRMQQTVLQDPLPLLHKITAPTLLLWGRQDRLIPFSNASDYLQAIAGSRLVALENMGHLPHEEDPQRALPAVREFLLGRTPSSAVSQ